MVSYLPDLFIILRVTERTYLGFYTEELTAGIFDVQEQLQSRLNLIFIDNSDASREFPRLHLAVFMETDSWKDFLLSTPSLHLARTKKSLHLPLHLVSHKLKQQANSTTSLLHNIS
jgi:hypothetical protein